MKRPRSYCVGAGALAAIVALLAPGAGRGADATGPAAKSEATETDAAVDPDADACIDENVKADLVRQAQAARRA